MRSNKTPGRPAFTLIEVALSLFVLSIMILIFGSFTFVRTLNFQTSRRAQAAALADEQINVLRRMGFSALSNQTNGAWRGVLYHAGAWEAVAEGSAGHSAPNALELPLNAAITNGLSGRILWPAGIYDTATLEAKWKVATDTAAGWRIGYIFHAQDSANHYRLQLAATGTDIDSLAGGTQNVLLEKIVSGTATKIWSGASTVALATNTWYTLKLDLAPVGSPTIKILINNNQQDSNSIADTTFTSGVAAAAVWNGAHVFLDDAQTTVNSLTSTWNFDADTDLPAAWVRLSLNSLPDGTPNTFDDNGLLTIAAYPSGSTTLKQVTVKVSWSLGSSSRSYTSTGLIGQSDLGL